MIKNLHEVVMLLEQGWSGKRVLVIGDVMLDRYVWGHVERISPEAPVPVVSVRRQGDQPGGAANVAMNVVRLGAPVRLIGFRGEDVDGMQLSTVLMQNGIDSALTTVPGHPTTSKLRIIGGQQQMLRLDVERSGGYPREAFDALLHAIDSSVVDADVVVLSDYAKGVLTEEVCRFAVQRARGLAIPVLVDPKQRNFERYRGATTICPNLHELSIATGVPASEVEANLEAAQQLVKQFDLDSLTVTMSEKGIAVVTSEQRIVAPALARQVFDVSGAGDTVLATLALCYACRIDPETAVELANAAAGIVVGKVGTVPVTQGELLTSLMPQIEHSAGEKVLPLDRLVNRIQAWRSAGDRIVFTNGCFDLLHIGHITLLEQARRLGDRLIVAINSDASVRGLKGTGRPIVSEDQRARVMAALSAVDAVFVFDEPTPLNVILSTQPDVIVKGGDYSESTVVGAEEVKSWGGRVAIVPIVEGFSTTRLIARANS